MISSIRSRMSGKVFKYILWGILISIPGGTLLVGLMDRVSGSKRGGAVATVNGYTITNLELRDKVFALERRVKEVRAQFGEYADYFLQVLGLSGNPIDVALGDLVREKLLLDAAAKMGVNDLSEDYVTGKVADPVFVMQNLSWLIPPYLFNALGELDHAALQKYLRRQGVSVDQFEAAVEASLKQAFALSLLPSAVSLPSSALNRAMLEQGNARQFAVLLFKLDRFIDQVRKNPVVEKEITEFFANQNRLFKRYWAPEERTATVWAFTPAEYGIKVLEKEAKIYHSRNKQQFGDKKFADARKEIEQLIRQEKFKNRFSADARRYIASAKNDNSALQGFVKKRNASKSIVTINQKQAKSTVDGKIFSLKAPGKMGSVVDSDSGYLVLLDDVKASYEPKFESVRKDVEDDFYRHRAQKELKKAIDLSAQELSGDNVKAVADKWGASIRKISVDSDNTKRWEQIDKDGLPVSRMKKMIHAGYSINQASPTGGYVVLLEEITQTTEALDQSTQQPDGKKLKADEMQLFTPAFIASLQNNATIEYKNLQVTR